MQHDLRVPMADGATLLADRYAPADDHAPLVLVRTPYGRSSMSVPIRMIAERGYQVVAVSLRGTGGSGGRFTGWTLEPADVTALLAWLREQPWFPGAFATWGASFLGYTQWALATEPIPEWRAAVIQDAPAEVYHSFMYRGGAFALSDWLGWVQRMRQLEHGVGVLGNLARSAPAGRRLRRATRHLPVVEADTVAADGPVDYYREWLRHPEPGAFWADSDHRGNVANMPPVVYVAGGWQDIFLPGSLEDVDALRASGRQVRLLVGPWTHGMGMFSGEFQRDVFAVLDHALRGEGDLPPAPVRVYVTGAGEWHSLPAWPPPGQLRQTWYLHGSGELSTRNPVDGAPSAFRYDPADPTPTVGGALIGVRAGVKDVRRVEARADVLTFTSPLLLDDVEVVGPVAAEVHVRTSSPHADVYVRLCDVDRRGRSRHVCDGLARMGADTPVDADGVRVARVELWPTAHRFRRGHRVGLHVAGGSHPRFQRNLGTGDQLGTELVAVDHEVLHGPAHPSAVRLPVVSG